MNKIKQCIQKNIFKAFFGFLLFLFLLPVVLAGGKPGSGTVSGSESFSGSDANAGAVAGVNIDSHDSGYSYNPAVDLSKSVPNSIAPNPHVGYGVCDSAYTFSIGWSGLGTGFGIPVSDDDCNRREDAKTVKSLGAPNVAFEVMCDDIRVFRASYRARKPCYPSEDLIDELSDDELVLLEQYKEQERKRLADEDRRKRHLKAYQKADSKRNIFKEMDHFQDVVNQKLDNIQRLSNLK